MKYDSVFQDVAVIGKPLSADQRHQLFCADEKLFYVLMRQEALTKAQSCCTLNRSGVFVSQFCHLVVRIYSDRNISYKYSQVGKC